MTTEAEDAPRLKPNLKKIVEAILFLIEHARDRKLTLTQYDIVKSLFAADVFHLNRYGRPITFDNYVAMKFGPVPSAAYDMLKPSYAGARILGEKWPLWEREPAPEHGRYAFKYVKAKRRANLKRLSETDVAALTEALGFIKTKSFDEIRDWTHLNPAYKAAWKGDGQKSYPMDYTLLIENGDTELATELAHASKFV